MKNNHHLSSSCLYALLGAALALAALLAPVSTAIAHEEEKKTWNPEEKWSGSVADFDKKDAANPPAQGGVVFLGSSSFRMWDVERFFPGYKVVNRGFGGSTMPDAVHFAER